MNLLNSISFSGKVFKFQFINALSCIELICCLFAPALISLEHRVAISSLVTSDISPTYSLRQFFKIYKNIYSNTIENVIVIGYTSVNASDFNYIYYKGLLNTSSTIYNTYYYADRLNPPVYTYN